MKTQPDPDRFLGPSGLADMTMETSSNIFLNESTGAGQRSQPEAGTDILYWPVTLGVVNSGRVKAHSRRVLGLYVSIVRCAYLSGWRLGVRHGRNSRRRPRSRQSCSSLLLSACRPARNVGWPFGRRP